MSCANAIKKQIVEVNGKKRQKTCVKVPRRQIAFVNVTKDRKYKLTHQKRNNNNNAAKRQTACVIAAKRQMASSILEEESTDNSLPVSLLFKKKKHSCLCSTFERP